MLIAWVASVQPSDAARLELAPGQGVVNLIEQMVVVAGPGFDLGDAAARAEAAKQALGKRKDQSTTAAVPDGSWLFAELINTGQEKAIWRLDTGAVVLSGLRVHIVRGTQVRDILTADFPNRPLDQRDHPGRWVSSQPIVVSPGESIALWVELEFGDARPWMTLSLEPETEFDARRVRDTSANAAYFAVGAAMVLFFVTFSILLQSASARWYAVFFGCLLLLQLHFLGYLSRYIFPAYPALYLDLMRPLQLAVLVAYLVFVSRFLQTRQLHPWLHKILIGVGSVAAVITAIEFLFYWDGFNDLAMGMAALFALVCALSAITAIRDGQPGSSYFVAGVVILFSYILVGLVSAYALPTHQMGLANWIIFCLQILDGAVFAAAIVRQTFALRRDRDRALQAELTATRDKLALSQSLLDANRDRDEALVLADRHRERLALTGHDLRQPLASLKMALSEVEAASPDLGDKVRSGLDYLNSVLTDAMDDSDPHLEVPQSRTTEDHEVVPLQVVLDNVARMFWAEATSKGLDLTVRPSDIDVRTDPVMLIRIISNLVSNAIRYTPAGRILIGARRRGSTINLEVWDTGIGLDEAEISQATGSYWRASSSADHSEGSGLGLTSVQNISQALGLALEIHSVKGRGSLFRLTGLPVAD